MVGILSIKRVFLGRHRTLTTVLCTTVYNEDMLYKYKRQRELHLTVRRRLTSMRESARRLVRRQSSYQTTSSLAINSPRREMEETYLRIDSERLQNTSVNNMNIAGALHLRIDVHTRSNATGTTPMIHLSPRVRSRARDVRLNLILRRICRNIQRREIRRFQSLEDIENELGDILSILRIAVVSFW